MSRSTEVCDTESGGNCEQGLALKMRGRKSESWLGSYLRISDGEPGTDYWMKSCSWWDH